MSWLNRFIKPVNYLPENQHLAYFLGVICGDGCLFYNKVRLLVKDKDFADEFYIQSKMILDKLGINVKRYTHRNYYIVQIASLGLSSYLLNKYGILKTKEWQIPEFIKQSSDEEIIRAYLRGLFDSEGSTRKYEVRMQIINPVLIEISILLSKLGINNTYNIEKRLTKSNNLVYNLSITHEKNLNLFKKKIGFSIQRKQDILVKNVRHISESKSKTKFLKKNKRNLAELYKQGYTLQEVADKYNIRSLMTIRKYIQQVLKSDYYIHKKDTHPIQYARL